MTLPEASRTYGIAHGTLRSWVHRGLLPARKLGRDWHVEEGDVARLARVRPKRGRPPRKK